MSSLLLRIVSAGWCG
ncbi:hypothetical protein V5G93_13250 [Escherichia albertii]|nr:hypothetical protein [Escherichia albertii]MCZ8807899.1 hypothetical protein [Escherichia albertii]